MARPKDILIKDEQRLGSRQLFDPKSQSEFLKSETGHIREKETTPSQPTVHPNQPSPGGKSSQNNVVSTIVDEDFKKTPTKPSDSPNKARKHKGRGIASKAVKTGVTAGIYAFNKSDDSEDDTDPDTYLISKRKRHKKPSKPKLEDKKKNINKPPVDATAKKKNYKAQKKIKKEQSKIERRKKYARKAQSNVFKGKYSFFARYRTNKTTREAGTKTLLLLLQSATPALFIAVLLILVLIVGGLCASMLFLPQSKGYGTLSANEQAIAAYLRSKNVDDLHIAAIMGNLYAESACDPNAIESTGEGHGLAQWSFARKERLFAYASNKGKNWNELDVQLDLLWDELNGLRWTKDTFTYFLSIDNLEEATEFFMTSFEAPGILRFEERLSRAQYYYQQLTTVISGDGAAVVAAARSQVGKPYRLGSPYTFAVGIESAAYDCSGLVKWAYTQVGVALQGRTAATICEGLLAEGREISAEEAQPGDIVGWRGNMFGDGWDHVAIYAGDDQIIEAGGMSDCVNESVASQRGISAYFRIYH